MQVQKSEIGYLIRFERGEKVMEGLLKFVKQKKIPGGMLIGLGAVEHTDIGFYDLSTKKYEHVPFEQDMELTNLSGNIAWLNDQPICHCHVTLSDRNCRAFAGHLFETVASVTVEIWLQPSGVHTDRSWDEAIGLNLLKLQSCPIE